MARSKQRRASSVRPSRASEEPRAVRAGKCFGSTARTLSKAEIAASCWPVIESLAPSLNAANSNLDIVPPGQGLPGHANGRSASLSPGSTRWKGVLGFYEFVRLMGAIRSTPGGPSEAQAHLDTGPEQDVPVGRLGEPAQRGDGFTVRGVKHVEGRARDEGEAGGELEAGHQPGLVQQPVVLERAAPLVDAVRQHVHVEEEALGQ